MKSTDFLPKTRFLAYTSPVSTFGGQKGRISLIVSLFSQMCTFRALPADPYKGNCLIGIFDLKSTQSVLLGETAFLRKKRKKSER